MATFYFIGDEFQHNFYLLKECSKLSIVPDLKSDLNWKCLVAKAPTLTKANLKSQFVFQGYEPLDIKILVASQLINQFGTQFGSSKYSAWTGSQLFNSFC